VCHMPLIKNPTCSLLPTRTQFRADGVIRQARVRSPLAGLVALVEQVRGSHCRAWVGSLRITKVPLSHLDPEPVMSTVEKSRQTRPLSSGGNSEAGNRSRNESIAGVTPPLRLAARDRRADGSHPSRTLNPTGSADRTRHIACTSMSVARFSPLI
jgi:hypothetical protein